MSCRCSFVSDLETCYVWPLCSARMHPDSSRAFFFLLCVILKINCDYFAKHRIGAVYFLWSSKSLCTLLLFFKRLRPSIEKKKVKVLFYPVLPDFLKSIAFWKVSRLRPFIFLVRPACRWRWVWSTNVMTETRENRSTRSKTQNQSECLYHESYMDCPGIEPVRMRWKGGDSPTEPWHVLTNKN
jgi:hypothetical protein